MCIHKKILKSTYVYVDNGYNYYKKNKSPQH